MHFLNIIVHFMEYSKMLNTVHPQSQIHVSLCFIKAEDPREAHSGKKGITNIYLNMYLYQKIFCLIFEGLKKKVSSLSVPGACGLVSSHQQVALSLYYSEQAEGPDPSRDWFILTHFISSLKH